MCKKGMGALKPRDRTKRKKQSRKKGKTGGPGVGAGGTSMMAIP